MDEPRDELSEKAVLGAVLIDPEATMERLAHRLSPEALFRPRPLPIVAAQPGLDMGEADFGSDRFPGRTER